MTETTTEEQIPAKTAPQTDELKPVAEPVAVDVVEFDEQETEVGGKTVGEVRCDNPFMVAENVNVWYGENHAIRDVTLEIGKKEVIALIGPSGCGKSTFLRCLNRMNETIETARVTGNITLDGNDIYSKKQDPVTLRARVGMVFQKPNPFPKAFTTTSRTDHASTAWPQTAPSSMTLCIRALSGRGYSRK